jgi:hypothetical protein
LKTKNIYTARLAADEERFPEINNVKPGRQLPCFHFVSGAYLNTVTKGDPLD